MTPAGGATRVERYTRDGLTFDVRDGGPLEARGAGDGDGQGVGSGAPVVLLHGWPQDGSAFDAVAVRLQAAGLRTLTPDQRGYSPGARPRGRAAYRMSECAADVVALLDAAGVQRAHVVGHDWGGAVAWSLAEHQRERVASLVVLSTPHPSALAWSFLNSSQGLRSWYMGLFQVPWLAETLLRATLERQLRGSGLPADRAAYYAARMREPGALTASLGWYRALALSSGLTGSSGQTGSSRPTRITTPTTYLWGQQDVALGRAAAERTIRSVAGPYRFVELDAGHWLPETRPVEVAEEILARVEDAR